MEKANLEQKIQKNWDKIKKFSECKGRLKSVSGMLLYKKAHTCTDVGSCELSKALQDLHRRVTHEPTPTVLIYKEEQTKFHLLGLNIPFPDYQEIKTALSLLRFGVEETVPGPSSLPAVSSSVAMPLATPPVATAVRPNSQPGMPLPPPPPVATPPPAQEDSAISVKWNTHAANMSSSIPNLLEDEKFVDVTLACDGRYIKCHKVILGACSTYFEELLSVNPCQHPIILMKDFQFWEVQAIVDFIYRGVVNIPQHQLPNLLQAANILQIKGLTGAKSETEAAESELVSEEDPTPTPSVTPTPTPIQKVPPVPTAPLQGSFRHKTLLLNFGKRRTTRSSTNQGLVQSSVKSPKDTSSEPQNKLSKITSSFCYEVSQLQSAPVSPALSSSGSSLNSCQDSGPSALVSSNEQDVWKRLQDVSTINKQDSSDRSQEASSPGHFEVLTVSSLANIKEEPQDELYSEDTGDPFDQQMGS